eukprot:c8496_g1_i1.p1 GENE.c8496_g1_i1~~c8496_g1_i1.p1  ORF type:complete len:179 (-),score=56.96 c8496_g1_i1:40-576(-)
MMKVFVVLCFATLAIFASAAPVETEKTSNSADQATLAPPTVPNEQQSASPAVSESKAEAPVVPNQVQSEKPPTTTSQATTADKPNDQVAPEAPRKKGMFSDIRLKKDIVLIGEADGLKWYRFKYTQKAAELDSKINTNEEQKGVMAQDLLETSFSHAVSKAADGFYVVDYSALPPCPF